MADLFDQPKKTAKPKAAEAYTAKDIEVLEGLEPVRKRPGMYVGGTDANALHHLAVEIVDNAMDEAVSGFATAIAMRLIAPDTLAVEDDGRGIPVDPHPKFKDKSALEVITTTLHSGGKFSGNAYYAAGGLHGVGLAVVNALSHSTTIEVRRDGKVFRQSYSRGKAVSPLETAGKSKNTGTTVTFSPDPEIFPDTAFSPERLFGMAKNKAFLFKGVTVLWECCESLASEKVPAKARLHYPNGLADLLAVCMDGKKPLIDNVFQGRNDFPNHRGHVEWAVSFIECPGFDDGFMQSYCNTIATVNGGTHEAGLRMALLRGIKGYADIVNSKKAADVTADDILNTSGIALSVFLNNPAFQGQTKEKLTSPEASKLVENAVKDQFDHWLAEDPKTAAAVLDHLFAKAEERKRRRKATEVARASVTKKLRLPGKLADCTRSAKDGTELFIVEGDSAGGSAKQARNREMQAVLPIRGKILNVASASLDKFNANQEVGNLIEALGCGTRQHYNSSNLRYDKVIIMTDADVDGAHIASLLMTLFYQEMPQLITDGHLYLARPPLFRLSSRNRTVYATEEADRDRMLASDFKGSEKVEISRFKGLGEMMAFQLKETTMDPKTRTLLRVQVDDDNEGRTLDTVDRLMGRKAEARFVFIKENAQFAKDLDI